MIWSIMPEDFLFATETEQPQQNLQCCYQGRQLLLRPCGDGLGEITALLSTDPADFLDQRFSMGRRVPII